MRVVLALGGNALIKRGEPLEAEVQRRNVRVAAQAVSEVAREHEVVVSHGNGPQVGLLALEAEAYRKVKPYPLDVLGAESEGMIGYLIEQELMVQLPGRAIATLLTQVEVAADDPAFKQPSKPIGPLYPAAEAGRLERERGWRLAVEGAHCRRVVPSPEPLRILEINAIRLLVDAGVVVICAGGGGIPVAIEEDGAIRGLEGVIDKDLASALLARELKADALVMLTDVEAVYDGWGTAQARPIARTTPAALRAKAFAPGSMGPKVEAACRFVEAGGHFAAIGTLAAAPAIVRQEAGTIVLPERA